MAEYGRRDLPQRWDVFVTPAVPVVDNELPPGENQRVGPPISSTLISRERDAVLVDAFRHRRANAPARARIRLGEMQVDTIVHGVTRNDQAN